MGGVIVGILLLTALVIPVLSFSTDETTIRTNTGSYFTTADEGEHTIVFSADSISFDGATFDYPIGFGEGSARNATLMIGEDWILRADNNMKRLVISGPPQDFDNLGNLSSGDITATISGTDVTFTMADSSTETRTGLEYVIADKGDYVMTYNPYIVEDTPIIAGIRSQTATPNTDVFEIIEGSVGDIENMTYTTCRAYVPDNTPTTGVITASTFTADTTEITTNLLKLDKITQVASLFSGDDITITITYVIVPVEIEYENPSYVGNQNATILNLIPLLITIGLILVIVNYAFMRRE